jgi:formiminotetrahydrofolate cyclodeaminase
MDAEAFAALMRTKEPSADAVVEATDVPLTIAERVSELLGDLRSLGVGVDARYRSDFDTAWELARSARGAAISTARLNLAAIPDAAVRQALEERLQTLK